MSDIHLAWKRAIWVVWGQAGRAELGVGLLGGEAVGEVLRILEAGLLELLLLVLNILGISPDGCLHLVLLRRTWDAHRWLLIYGTALRVGK